MKQERPDTLPETKKAPVQREFVRQLIRPMVTIIGRIFMLCVEAGVSKPPSDEGVPNETVLDVEYVAIPKVPSDEGVSERNCFGCRIRRDPHGSL